MRGVRSAWRIAVVGLLAVCWAMPAAAQDETPAGDTPAPSSWLNVSGSLRADYFSSSRSLDDREHFGGASLWLKAAPRFGDHVGALFEGWIRNSRLFEAEATEGKLRQGYADVTLGPLDLRLGKQLIFWGRADRINPTDNLTPRDFTLLVPEDDDQRFGVSGLKATLHARDLVLTGIWLPVFSPHTIPLGTFPFVTFREIKPSFALGRSQWGVKIEQTGRTVDWSLSYFDGFDLFPNLGVGRVMAGPAAPPIVEVLLRHHRLRVVGADAATTVERFGLRGEVAYASGQDRSGRNPEIKNPYLFLVLGADRTFLEYLNVNLQYIFRAIVNFRDPAGIADSLRRAVAIEDATINSQLDRFQHAASARVSYKWLNETLEAEVAGVYGFTRDDYAIRPKVTYAFTDRLKGTVGADVFRGPQPSFFGRIRDNSTAYAELKFSF